MKVPSAALTPSLQPRRGWLGFKLLALQHSWPKTEIIGRALFRSFLWGSVCGQCLGADCVFEIFRGQRIFQPMRSAASTCLVVAIN